MALDSSYKSKMQLKELNQNKIKNELKKAEETLAFMIASHKDAVTKHIDKVCSNMEKELNDMITKQKSDKESLYERIEKLKNIAEKEIPKMKEESENFKKDSNDNVNTLRQMLKEAKFIEDIQRTMNDINTKLKKAKEERYYYLI